MDYCPTCRRHLNGALACPGCGAYSDDRRKAEFQERYQSPYGRVPPQRPAPAAFSPAYGGYASAPQVLAQPPQPRVATPPPVEYPPVDHAPVDHAAVDYAAVDYAAVDYAAAGYAGPEFAGEAEPVAPEGAYAPTALLSAEQEHHQPEPEPLSPEEDPGGTRDGEDAEYGEDAGEPALVPAGAGAGAGRAERRQAGGGRGQNHRQSRRRRRSVAFTAVGLVVGGLVAWEGGVSALSLGEFGQAPVASPDTGPSGSPSAGAGGDGASASASAQPIAGTGVPTGRAASPSAKPSAKASASATHAASASPTAERTVVAAGGASTTAPATTHPTPSPTTASSSPSPTCSAHFLWWCTG